MNADDIADAIEDEWYAHSPISAPPPRGGWRSRAVDFLRENAGDGWHQLRTFDTPNQARFASRDFKRDYPGVEACARGVVLYARWTDQEEKS